MKKILKGSNGRFVINFFKSVGIACTLMATSSCSDNIVNKTNRGNEIMKPSKFRIVEEDMEYAEMDETDNESTQETQLKKEDYVVVNHEGKKKIEYKDKPFTVKYNKEYYKTLSHQEIKISSHTEVKFLFKNNFEVPNLLENINDKCLIFFKHFQELEEQCEKKSNDKLKEILVFFKAYFTLMDMFLEAIDKLGMQEIKIIDVKIHKRMMESLPLYKGRAETYEELENIASDVLKEIINDLDKKYFEISIGQMHIYLVYNMLIDIRNECIRKGGE